MWARGVKIPNLPAFQGNVRIEGMTKPLHVVQTFVVAGVVLLGNAMAQTSATKPATPAAQTKAAPAASKTPSAQTKTGTAVKKDESITKLTTQKEKASYAIGMNWGLGVRHQEVDVDDAMVLQGLKDALAGGKLLLTDQEARATLTQLQQEMQAKMQAKAEHMAENNKKEGETFLAANKTKEGVVTLPSGLQYKIITAGTGPKPNMGDSVVCNYRGTLISGAEFDSSYKRGQPATFPVGGVIRGWTEALQLMPVGSKWQLFVPSELAYSTRGAGNGDIGPNATLIFEVELISIKPKDVPADKPKDDPADKPKDPSAEKK